MVDRYDNEKWRKFLLQMTFMRFVVNDPTENNLKE